MSRIRMLRLAIVSCLAGTATILLAADGPAKRLPAVQAGIDKRDAAVTKAAAAFTSAVAAANRQLVREVETLQRRFMASGDLAGANDAVAAKAEAESDPRANRPPAPPVDTTPTLLGNWVVRDDFGTVSHYTLKASEARLRNNGDVGELSRDGAYIIVRWQRTGWVDRFALTADGRIFKESWNVGNHRRFPQDPPDHLATGERE